MAACMEVKPWRLPMRRFARCLARRLASLNACRNVGRPLRLLLRVRVRLSRLAIGCLRDLMPNMSPGDGLGREGV